MDDLGTLIYIAFAVISLLAGWFKSKKKKQEAAKPAVEKSIQNEREPLREPVQTEFNAMRVNRRVQPISQPVYESQKKSRQVEEFVDEPEILVDESSPPALLGEEFDARKAFIYSEILKRPIL